MLAGDGEFSGSRCHSCQVTASRVMDASSHSLFLSLSLSLSLPSSFLGSFSLRLYRLARRSRRSRRGALRGSCSYRAHAFYRARRVTSRPTKQRGFSGTQAPNGKKILDDKSFFHRFPSLSLSLSPFSVLFSYYPLRYSSSRQKPHVSLRDTGSS